MDNYFKKVSRVNSNPAKNGKSTDQVRQLCPVRDKGRITKSHDELDIVRKLIAIMRVLQSCKLI